MITLRKFLKQKILETIGPCEEEEADSSLRCVVVGSGSELKLTEVSKVGGPRWPLYVNKLKSENK